MDFPDEAIVRRDHATLYSRGQTLSLTTHKVPKPWGWQYYPMPPGLASEETGLSEEDKDLSLVQMVFQDKNQPHNLNRQIQRDESKKMKVEILDVILGNDREGYTPGTQKLKCKVLQVPSNTTWAHEQHTPALDSVIFIKAFDPMFYPRFVDAIEMNWKVTARADMALSNEAGSYAFLHKHGLTGAPHIAPQWFGCWTLEVETTDPAHQGRTRHVGAIALEFVDGICLGKLFETDELGHYPTRDDDVKTLIQVDETTRLGTIEDLLANIVVQYKIGVNHIHIHPENVIVSFRRGSEVLERPRVSLVGYTDSVVGPLRQPPRNMFAKYPRPIHPWFRFDYSRLEPFFDCHWLPRHWQDDDDCLRLDQWLVDTFGPFENNDKYIGYMELDTELDEKAAALLASGNFHVEIEEAAVTQPTDDGDTDTAGSHDDLQKPGDSGHENPL
ncbi:hypothetical protein CTA2_4803 [Colletotrichum tanaceti]|uniref:Protein kinase domain-containing protein n=1 Tax=Colletotrichum tanaceti TaxID=1306861 RepID=A0A4U6XEP7_9PEZI|nr:hypothetical protein CTA2_4803 [Colletotrichum tanaceti]TKW53662.1 hypothetical protein CTA1_5493 [Colletotrichum tanaceti]